MPGGPHGLGWAETAGYDPSRARGSRAHTRYMGRIIGTILGVILAIWFAVTVAGGIFATLKAPKCRRSE